jgi:hypothetical protein
MAAMASTANTAATDISRIRRGFRSGFSFCGLPPRGLRGVFLGVFRGVKSLAADSPIRTARKGPAKAA